MHAGNRRRTDKRKSFTETDYARLLDAAHPQLGGPLVLVWDNLNTHVIRAMRELLGQGDRAGPAAWPDFVTGDNIPFLPGVLSA